MPDYIYLLESRLSADQQNALRVLREAAREAETILFLVGDAVRDLTSGHAVHEMEVALHGNAIKLKKKLEKSGVSIWGEDEATRSLYLCFPGTVRVDVVSTHRTEFPKPGKAVIHPASIHEDLRRRDFTVNAMAISLNEGSFGLLMDPLNGAADVENRTLRLVSGYGFLEDPSLLIRATRYKVRLGWEMDPRTQNRYEEAKNEGVIQYLPAHARSFELEQIGHEEEALKVLRAFESEGWMKVLFPAWTASCADEEKLQALHDLAVDLLMQGVHADTSAAQMRLLTAKLGSKDLNSLKKLMLRPGFVEEWSGLDAQAAAFAKVLLSKSSASPSVAFKLFTSYDPESVLWLGFTSKDKAVQERYRQFLKEWPEVRQQIPHALMQELRITPELPVYNELLDKIFLEMIDGRLTTPEEMRAFLEPYSPPAPPPRETVKRTRARRGEARVKEQAFEEEEEDREEREDEEEEGLGAEEGLQGIGVGSDDEEDMGMGAGLPRSALETPLEEEEEEGEGEEGEEIEEEEVRPAAASTKKPKAGVTPAKAAGPAAPTSGKPVAATRASKPPAKAPAAKVQPAVKAPEPERKKAVHLAKAEAHKGRAKPEEKKAPRPAPAVKGKPAPRPALAKAPAKKPEKAPAKAAHKPQAKPRPAKSVGAKVASTVVKRNGAGVRKPAAVKPARPQPKKTARKR